MHTLLSFSLQWPSRCQVDRLCLMSIYKQSIADGKMAASHILMWAKPSSTFSLAWQSNKEGKFNFEYNMTGFFSHPFCVLDETSTLGLIHVSLHLLQQVWNQINYQKIWNKQVGTSTKFPCLKWLHIPTETSETEEDHQWNIDSWSEHWCSKSESAQGIYYLALFYLSLKKQHLYLTESFMIFWPEICTQH